MQIINSVGIIAKQTKNLTMYKYKTCWKKNHETFSFVCFHCQRKSSDETKITRLPTAVNLLCNSYILFIVIQGQQIHVTNTHKVK